MLKAHFSMRLARLEAQLAKSAANEIGLKGYNFNSALAVIVGFHAGKLTAGDSLATAMASALDMTANE